MVAAPARWRRAAACPSRSYFRFRLRKFCLEVRRLLADIEPIEKSVRRLQPDAEPAGDLEFFGTLAGLDFRVSCDHFRAAFAETRDVQDALDPRAFTMGVKFVHQLI